MNNALLLPIMTFRRVPTCGIGALGFSPLSTYYHFEIHFFILSNLVLRTICSMDRFNLAEDTEWTEPLIVFNRSKVEFGRFFFFFLTIKRLLKRSIGSTTQIEDLEYNQSLYI